ncbi:hypothetical protein QTP88_022216 [Uroleucon formosanum]
MLSNIFPRSFLIGVFAFNLKHLCWMVSTCFPVPKFITARPYHASNRGHRTPKAGRVDKAVGDMHVRTIKSNRHHRSTTEIDIVTSWTLVPSGHFGSRHRLSPSCQPLP